MFHDGNMQVHLQDTLRITKSKGKEYIFASLVHIHCSVVLY